MAATIRFRLPDPTFAVLSPLVTDLAGNPHVVRCATADGELAVETSALDRIALHLLCTAGEAGTLMVTADNRGQGYVPRAQPYDLLQELLYSNSGQRMVGSASAELLVALGKVLVQRENAAIAEAQALLRQRKETPRRVQVLDNGNPVRETTIDIEQETLVPLLGWGTGLFDRVPYRDHLLGLCDYYTAPFYLPSLCPDRGTYQWENREAVARWCRERGIVVKGHPLVWLYGDLTPDWLRAMSYPELRAYVFEHVYRNVEHFRGLIDRWDVINEAHDWANSLDLSSEQLLEITDTAARAAKVANPSCMVVVNICLPWGDYLQWRHTPHRLSPYEYCQRLIRAGTPFDVIGIQLYNAYASPFPHRDLFAMSQVLDRFGALGKEIHVTEFAVPSQGAVCGVWRGAEWTPELQARYAVGMYEVAASKPFVKAISWWFPVDVPGSEWSSLGLITADHQPKPVLNALVALRQSWLTRARVRSDGEGFVTFAGMPGRYRFRWQDRQGVQVSTVLEVGSGE